jgi:hypothetical protein
MSSNRSAKYRYIGTTDRMRGKAASDTAPGFHPASVETGVV